MEYRFKRLGESPVYEGNVTLGDAADDEQLLHGVLHFKSEHALDPTAPNAGDGGIVYVRNDGKIYFASDSTSPADLTAAGGGGGGLAALHDDTSPQLGGDLDLNGQTITTASNADVNIDPDGTGQVVLTAAPGLGVPALRVTSSDDTSLIQMENKVGGSTKTAYIGLNNQDHLVVQTNNNAQDIYFNIGSSSGGVLRLIKDGSERNTAASENITLLAQGDMRYEDASGGEYVGFQAPATVATSHVYTWPSALPGSDLVLQSDSSGTLSWVAAGGGGSSLTTSEIDHITVPALAVAGTMYICDTTTQAFSIELPGAGSVTNGETVDILALNANATGNAVTIDIATTPGTDTINGVLFRTLNADYQNLTLVSNGVDKWYIR